MTEQPQQQPDRRSTDPSVDTGGLVVEELDAEREGLDRAWAEFTRARASLAEVMSDDELRTFGFNVEALDERP